MRLVPFVLTLISLIAFTLAIGAYLTHISVLTSYFLSIAVALICCIQTAFVWYFYIEKLRQENLNDETARIHPITELLNRKTIMEELQIQIRSAARHHYPYGIILIGMDRFGEINSRYGEKGGDSILHQIADTIVRTCRQEDCIGHFESDQFVVGASHSDAEGIMALAKRIQKELNAQQFYARGGQTQVTACWGLAAAPPFAYELDLLIRQAMHALKTAKHRGQDRIVYEGGLIAPDSRQEPDSSAK